jgi:hypothetical protein
MSSPLLHTVRLCAFFLPGAMCISFILSAIVILIDNDSIERAGNYVFYAVTHVLLLSMFMLTMAMMLCCLRDRRNNSLPPC